MEAVLPRIGTKSKRKRRKPMPPWLKFYLAMVVMDCFWLAYNVFKISSGGGKYPFLYPIFAALWSFYLYRDWPRFKKEWDAWRRDNEDE